MPIPTKEVFYWDEAEWDFNYYGHPRMDIHNLYVDVPNSKHSGFSFLLDVNYLILARGYSQGLHCSKSGRVTAKTMSQTLHNFR